MVRKLKIVKKSVAEVYKEFAASKKAMGVKERTLKTYLGQMSTIANRYHEGLWEAAIDSLSAADIENIYCKMVDAGLSANSIHSYSTTLKSFFSWCSERGYADVKVKMFKREETVKETYSNDELKILLRKPDVKTCSFCEYRNWVIVNLLVNNGVRAGTVRAILIKDIDFDNNIIYCRHTKNQKALTIPLSTIMKSILQEYLTYREGGEDDYLFCTECGEQLKELALRDAIERYNRKRGIMKTSIHAFRHTFARNYLIECGGNAFVLQKLLGHSTLDMTQHYCRIFDADITKDYDSFSPLARIAPNSSKRRITMK